MLSAVNVFLWVWAVHKSTVLKKSCAIEETFRAEGVLRILF